MKKRNDNNKKKEERERGENNDNNNNNSKRFSLGVKPKYTQNHKRDPTYKHTYLCMYDMFVCSLVVAKRAICTFFEHRTHIRCHEFSDVNLSRVL